MDEEKTDQALNKIRDVIDNVSIDLSYEEYVVFLQTLQQEVADRINAAESDFASDEEFGDLV